mmetsp:Transcript_48642/g.99313  ORF Transcript_48642/g.99313 Transcript_48642/m.99313 type:complete len:222 (-) Transcript_48642:713-1378(-)
MTRAVAFKLPVRAAHPGGGDEPLALDLHDIHWHHAGGVLRALALAASRPCVRALRVEDVRGAVGEMDVAWEAGLLHPSGGVDAVAEAAHARHHLICIEVRDHDRPGGYAHTDFGVAGHAQLPLDRPPERYHPRDLGFWVVKRNRRSACHADVTVAARLDLAHGVRANEPLHHAMHRRRPSRHLLPRVVVAPARVVGDGDEHHRRLSVLLGSGDVPSRHHIT